MTEKIQFSPGDLVHLRSGGPAMTVKGRNTFDQVMCDWFINGVHHSGSFHEDSLEHGKSKRIGIRG